MAPAQTILLGVHYIEHVRIARARAGRPLLRDASRRGAALKRVRKRCIIHHRLCSRRLRDQ